MQLGLYLLHVALASNTVPKRGGKKGGKGEVLLEFEWVSVSRDIVTRINVKVVKFA